jgi:maltooligosyltrehalose trehalohydrolase
MLDGRLRDLGAKLIPGGARFALFTTTAQTCAVRTYAVDGRAVATHPLESLGDGLFAAEIRGIEPGVLYKFVLNHDEWPDPYARFLPSGVHGPAMVVDSRYQWRHPQPAERPLARHVAYELHIGTFTEQGTFRAAEQRLPALVELGITAIELMPIAAFAGKHGWGYDGVALYAPHAPYGTPDDLRHFIDYAHGLGLAVWLDVVYNHFGPAGNYLSVYSPAYFTHQHVNAWGDAPDFRHPAMRQLVLDNVRYWLEEMRFDGLRLDATHAIFDDSPKHIVAEIAALASALRPKRLIIAEDASNDPARVDEWHADGVWADDFHHHVRVTLTGEREGYYGCYQPGAAGVAEAIRHGWSYRGQIYGATGEPRGKDAGHLPAEAFIYCLQNHDQIGNRAVGDRLTASISFDAYCAASMLLLFLPMTPLLFMGQEWAASSPFQYFTDHEPELGQAVSRGRREEFRHFEAFSDERLRHRIPDPQSPSTFERSRLIWSERDSGEHARVLALYRNMLLLRAHDPVLSSAKRHELSTEVHGDVLLVERWKGDDRRTLVINFGRQPAELPPGRAEALARGELLIASAGDAISEGRVPAERAYCYRSAL